MKKAVILHGYQHKDEYYDDSFPSPSNGHWKPWLQKQLLIHDINAQTPEVFMSWQLKYEAWAREFEKYEINEDTALVGHSCGGGFIVRWLSEHPNVKVDKVVLVAPWVDPFKEDVPGFFDFTIDPNLVSHTAGVVIFNSDDDHASIHKTVEILRTSIKDIEYREFHNYGHFNLGAMGTVEFPELRDHLIK